MIKYATHKIRTHSINDSDSIVNKKGDINDSGTESDGDTEAEKQQQQSDDIETSMSSRLDATSPTDTACSSGSPAMMCQSHLLYDQHSSEEELEGINGPSSIAAAEAAAASSILIMRGTVSSLVSERESSSLEPEELFDEACTSKRSSSTLGGENRKRSLAHSSDDELRNLLEPILTPVNFRTSPPLEAFKPNRSSHMFRSTTPLILTEASRGIENIKLCDNNSITDDDDDGGNGGGGGGGVGVKAGFSNRSGLGHESSCCSSGADGDNNSKSNNRESTSISASGNQNIFVSTSTLKSSNSSHHIYQPQPKYQFHYNSSRSSPASTSGIEIDVRSVSPPAKLFHCAISPRRRPMQRTHHATQRLQRPHRPCLDFDKMQQVSPK